MAGKGKSILLSILDWVPVKPRSPHATAFLKHYVEGSGEEYVIDEVPGEWQDWIVRATGGRPGKHTSLSPYNSGPYDLRHALGHFDVTVTRNRDGKNTYVISDVYEFGFIPHDRKQAGRHGFSLGQPSEWKVTFLRKMLPAKEYCNPGGLKETWEIKKVGKETFLFIPQAFLAAHGKPFPVKGQFVR
jgi:hypothetical protein